MAYFECLHEVKLVVDLTRCPSVVTADTKIEMKKILSEIQSGQFTDEWIAESEWEKVTI